MVSFSLAVYLVVLALVMIERIHELVRSNANVAALLARGGREVGRRHYRAMVLLHAAFLLACVVEVVALRRPFPGVVGWFALGGAIAAQVLRYWAVATLGDRWTTRIVFIPHAPPITAGPYRFVRHPNYLAVVLEMACIPLIHGAYVTALVFSLSNALLLSVRIRAEEAALGAKYERAFAATPRFIPGGRA
jgi:methyltransferase